MRVSKRASAVALGAAVALVAAGCGSGGGGDEPAAKKDGAIVIDGSQPEVGLVPANTTETGGGAIIDYLWTGLVEYPNEQGANPKLAVAESINTTDSKVYTIKIKKGTKFHDGTEVKAESFVKAWNWNAYSPNGAQNSSFFSDIQGFTDVQSVDPDDDGPKKAPEPKAKEMSGLKVVDDHTFEVTLAAPFSIFQTKLGYSAFYPMPDAFFSQGADAFGKKPIGNGPWKFVSWQDNVEIKLTRNDDYSVGDKGKIKDVTVKLYQDAGAAYNDLQAGNLDFQQQVPTSALAGAKYKTDLQDRFVDVPNAATALIAFPFYDKRFASPDLRRAVSLAVDRQSISDKIFSGSRKPADSWANPLTPGAKSGNCTSCSYNPEEAKALLAKAGGFQGEMVFYYNADASHKEWMEAVAQSVKNTLGIEARAEGIPTFAVFRQQINAKQMKGPYRAAWSQDYPDVENWIGPLYVTGGSSNDGSYSNPEVDRLYKEATSAPTVDGAHAKFAEAVTLVDKDTPSIPVYFYGQQSGFSTKIKKPELNVKGEIDLVSVELK